MKQRIAVVLLLGVLCNASAVILLVVDSPQDEPAARAWARSRPELKPLHTAYTNLIQTRLWPLKFIEMAEILVRKSKPPPTGGDWARTELANIPVRTLPVVPQTLFCQCSLLEGERIAAEV